VALVAALSVPAALAHPSCLKLEVEPGRFFINNSCDKCQSVALSVANTCGERTFTRRLEAGKREQIEDSQFPQCAAGVASSTAAIADINPCTPNRKPARKGAS
jgi:hypothetical protein